MEANDLGEGAVLACATAFKSLACSLPGGASRNQSLSHSYGTLRVGESRRQSVQAAVTEKLYTGCLRNNINLLVTVLEARKCKINSLAGRVSAEDPFPGWLVFLLGLHRVEGAGELSGVSLIKALIPPNRAPPL